jgi:outer membrane protein assembly factor BamA
MMRKTKRTGIWTVLAAVMLALVPLQVAYSQGEGDTAGETRAGLIAVQQAQKSKTTRAPQPDKAEGIVRHFEGIFLDDPSGFYPYFASVYHGGGLTLGAGYRKFYGDNTSWNIQGLYSFKNYKLIEGGTESKDHLKRRLSFGGKAGWRDATQVNYYGTGIQSSLDNVSSFRFQESYLDGHFVAKPLSWIPIKGSVRYEHWNTLEGQGNDPSIETVYTPQTAPGLGADPSYIHSQVGVGIDWRTSPGYTRKGGLYYATLHDYNNTNGGTYSFQRLDVDVIQYIPLLRENWVLVGRATGQTTLNDNDLIPYFLLPALGDGSSLRAFQTDRFRDRHSMVMTAEVRWIPANAVDMAVFYDAGKVTPHRSDFSFKQLKSDVGIGIRFHGLFVTPLRLDLAKGNEGWKLVISGSAVF